MIVSKRGIQTNINSIKSKRVYKAYQQYQIDIKLNVILSKIKFQIMLSHQVYGFLIVLKLPYDSNLELGKS